MSGSTLVASLTLAASFALAGLAFGSAYFAVLRWTADLYAGGGASLLPTVLTLGRFAAAIVFLGFAVRIGALPLLTSFLGFLLARGFALRTARTPA